MKNITTLLVTFLLCNMLCCTASGMIPPVSELGMLAVENVTYYTPGDSIVSTVAASDLKGSVDLELYNTGQAPVNCTGKYLALIIHNDVKQEYVLFPLSHSMNYVIGSGESTSISIGPLPGDFSGYMLPEGFEDMFDFEHVYMDLYWYDDSSKILIPLDSLELDLFS